MWGITGHSTEDKVQVAILLVAVLSVPIMLIPKPLIEILRKKDEKKEAAH